MPSAPPLPPVFPGTRPREALKPATQARLAQARFRRRAQPQLAAPMTITRFDPQAHALDVLLYWWSTAYTLGEHIDILGAVARTPMGFLKSYAGCDLLIVHEQDSAWPQWEGVAAVIWSDDVLPASRYRLHYWMAPHVRHPLLTAQIAQGVLHHLFEVRNFQLVWGITPVTNRPALRILLRLGFTERQHWPGATIDPHTGLPMDAVVTTLQREVWRVRAQRPLSQALPSPVAPPFTDEAWMYEPEQEDGR